MILSTGEVVLLSPEDADLAEMSWYRQKGRNTTYVRRGGRGEKHEYLHRVILERMTGRPLLRRELTHHKNDDGLDNRRGNLELVSTTVNGVYAWEKRERETGYPGVVFDKNPQLKARPYRAIVKIRGRRVPLGRYATAEEANEIVTVVRNAVEKENLRD